MNTLALRIRLLRSILIILALGLFTTQGCDDAASPPTEISVRITQPVDSSTVRDTVLRVLTEVSSNCGCQAYVEFHIDGVHQYSDYLPFYHFDWNIRDLSGWHSIATRVVVANRGEAWDSVRVLLNPADSLTDWRRPQF
jgi:hypothetical protein